jgi:hypothetical protein
MSRITAMNLNVPLLAEGHWQQRYLDAIFRDHITADKIKTYSYLGRDAALAVAEAFLIERPGRHVAIVLESNSKDRDVIREFYASTCRRLSWTSPPGDRWHVALAIPRLDAWALVDDHIRQEYESRIIQRVPDGASLEERERIERHNYLNLASKMGDLVASHPFDLDVLKQKSRQCRELCEFIESSFQEDTVPVPATASDWF